MRTRGFYVVHLIAAVTFVLGFAGTGFTGLIPGGGKAASDCYAEFDVHGASGSKKVTCTDGDPACDTDGQCQGTCTFSVAVCLNQTNVQGCTPKPLKRPAHVSGGLTAPTAQGAAAVCGPSGTIAVKLKGGKKANKRGRKKIKLTAIVTGKPSRETDQLTLICEPRQGACPPPVTTTTTTIVTATTAPNATTTTTSSTTTTTMCPEPCSCPGFNQFSFTNTQGAANCGGPGLVPPPDAPFTGQLFTDTGCSAKTADLGLSCLYIGGGNSVTVPASQIPDGSTSLFEAKCRAGDPSQGILLASSGTSSANCTKGAGPGKHCIPGNPTADPPIPPGAECTDDAHCAGPGTCTLDANCYFGPPLPIRNPPLDTCVLNVIQTDVSSSEANFTTGSSTLTIPLSSQVFLTGDDDAPCPKCVSGSCVGGRNDGGACTPVGTLLTSLDCLPEPAQLIGALAVTLGPLTSGSTTLTAGDGNFCPGQGPESPTHLSGFPGAFGKPAAQCIKETGSPAGSLTDLAAHPGVAASVYCIPPTGNGAVDIQADLPGPSAIGLNLNEQLHQVP